VSEKGDSDERLDVFSRLDESHVRLRHLDRDKLILEKDIETKTNTIFVDEVECHEGLRKSISVEDW
jgi:hypothetical protein